MSTEGLDELIGEARIVDGSAVALASTPIGVAVKRGSPRPDISNLDALRAAILAAKTIAVPGSTGGTFVTSTLLPRLGISNAVGVSVTARGAEAAHLSPKAGLVWPFNQLAN